MVEAVPVVAEDGDVMVGFLLFSLPIIIPRPLRYNIMQAPKNKWETGTRWRSRMLPHSAQALSLSGMQWRQKLPLGLYSIVTL